MRLHGYLLREIALPLVVWLGFLVTLMWVMAVLRGTDVLFGSQVTLWDFARVSAYLLPHFVAQAAPVAFLLALLIGLGRLSEDRELLAMQALGLKPRAFWVAPLLLSFAVSALLLALASGPQPRGLQAVQSLASEIIKRNLVGDVKGGVFQDQVQGITLYAGTVEQPGRWRDVMVYDERQPATPMLLLARRGSVAPGGPDKALTLELERGQLFRGGTDGDARVQFDDGALTMGVEETVFQKNRFRAVRDELTPGEMLEAAKAARAAGAEWLPLEVGGFWKLGQVLMPLSFAFLGVPLGLLRRTSGRARGVMATLLGYVTFYLLARASVSFGERGALSPLLAGQLPNLVFVLCGIAALVWAEKRGLSR
jgi:lipopolysaccharide export system permease protein